MPGRLLQILGDPLLGELGLVGEDLLERFGDLRLQGGAHEGDVYLRFIVVGQGGGLARAGQVDGAGEVNGGALDVAGVA